MITADSAQDIIDTLVLPEGYTASYGYNDNFTIVITIAGPEGWFCSFSSEDGLAQAMSVLNDHINA